MQRLLTLSASTQPDFQAALQTTDQVIRSHSKTFFLATALLPPAPRRAIRSLYAFCRSSDDLVDCADTTQQDLDAWRLEASLPPESQSNPFLLSWALVRESYGIDRRYEHELLDGIEMDLNFRPYATWEDLQLYCYRVASTVGLLSMPIIGYAAGGSFETAAPYAIQLGIALQLTNILRDVGEDAEHGRVYLPEEDLARFGLTTADIMARVYDQRFIRLMKFEISRARQLYAEALPGIAWLSPAARPAVGAAALLYRAILDQIEKIHYRVHTRRAYTSTLRKITMLPGILITIYRLPKHPRKTAQNPDGLSGDPAKSIQS
jgi:15-cis-phytoene synthase